MFYRIIFILLIFNLINSTLSEYRTISATDTLPSLSFESRKNILYKMIPTFSLRELLSSASGDESESLSSFQWKDVLPFDSHLLVLNKKYLFYLDGENKLYHHIDLDFENEIELCSEMPIMRNEEKNGAKLLYFFLKEAANNEVFKNNQDNFNNLDTSFRCVLMIWDENEASEEVKEAFKVDFEKEIWVHKSIISQKFKTQWFISTLRFKSSPYLLVKASYQFLVDQKSIYNRILRKNNQTYFEFDEYTYPLIYREENQKSFVLLIKEKIIDINSMLKNELLDDSYKWVYINFNDNISIDDEVELFNFTINLDRFDKYLDSFELYPFIFLISNNNSYIIASNGLNSSLVGTINETISNDLFIQNTIILNSTTLLTSIQNEGFIMHYLCSFENGCTRTLDQFRNSTLYVSDFNWNFFPTDYESLSSNELDSMPKLLHMNSIDNGTQLIDLDFQLNSTIPLSPPGSMFLFSIGRGIIFSIDNNYYISYPENNFIQKIKISLGDLIINSISPHLNHKSLFIIAQHTNYQNEIMNIKWNYKEVHEKISDIYIYYGKISFARGCFPACNIFGSQDCNLNTLSCECKKKFIGDGCYDCEEEDTIGEQCNYKCNLDTCIHGKCNKDIGICECNFDNNHGFWKDEANQNTTHCTECYYERYNISSSCTKCQNGWDLKGNQCILPICYGLNNLSKDVCSGNGICTQPDKCQCIKNSFGEPIWISSDCSIPTCFQISANNDKVCNGNGKCQGWNYCQCNEGYSGQLCEKIITIRESFIWNMLISSTFLLIEMISAILFIFFIIKIFWR